MGFGRLQVGVSQKRISCCYHCEERTAECHGTCERYKEERAERDEEYARFVVEERKYKAQNTLEVDRALNKRRCFQNKWVRRR